MSYRIGLGATFLLLHCGYALATTPVAVDDNASTVAGQTIGGSVSANDLNLDGPSDTFSLLSDACNGSVSLSAAGNYSYAPDYGFTGSDTFTYQVDDGAWAHRTQITTTKTINF